MKYDQFDVACRDRLEIQEAVFECESFTGFDANEDGFSALHAAVFQNLKQSKIFWTMDILMLVNRTTATMENHMEVLEVCEGMPLGMW